MAILLGAARMEEWLKKAGTELTWAPSMRPHADQKQRSDQFPPPTRLGFLFRKARAHSQKDRIPNCKHKKAGSAIIWPLWASAQMRRKDSMRRRRDGESVGCFKKTGR